MSKSIKAVFKMSFPFLSIDELLIINIPLNHTSQKRSLTSQIIANLSLFKKILDIITTIVNVILKKKYET